MRTGGGGEMIASRSCPGTVLMPGIPYGIRRRFGDDWQDGGSLAGDHREDVVDDESGGTSGA